MSKRRKKINKNFYSLKDTPTLEYLSVLGTFSGVRLFYIMSTVETTLLITRPDIFFLEKLRQHLMSVKRFQLKLSM